MSDNEDDIFDEEDSEEETEVLMPVKKGKPSKISKLAIATSSDSEEDENDDDDDDDDDDMEDDDDVEINLNDEIEDIEGEGEGEGIRKGVGEDDEMKPSDIIGTFPVSGLSANKPQELVEDNESDEEPDDSYLQKFDMTIHENYIDEFHPETQVHNYEEVITMSNVIRNKNNLIVDPLHRTIPILTKYERTRILGARAKQINSGARPYVNVPENIIEGHLIAQLELEQKRIPFIIRRPLPGKSGSEYWKVADLELIST